MKFKKVITVNNVARTFHFEQEEEREGNTIGVVLDDEDGATYAFTMKMDEAGIWTALPGNSPEWTAEESTRISDAINEHFDGEDQEERRSAGLNPWNILGS
jgi:hypothetical protein